MRNKNITTNIYRMEANDSLICTLNWFDCLIDFMPEGKKFLDYTNLFSPNEYIENDIVILKCFQ